MKRLVVLALSLVALAAAAIPAGAADGETRLTTTLTWKEEVDTGSDHGFGFAAVRLHGDRVCFGARWMNIETPLAAHIHVAPPGESGPVVVPLWMDPDMPIPHQSGNSAWGCVMADPAVVAAIVANPADYYVNLHTEEFPGGAVRGQLG
jgi:hypothetical protein